MWYFIKKITPIRGFEMHLNRDEGASEVFSHNSQN